MHKTKPNQSMLSCAISIVKQKNNKLHFNPFFATGGSYLTLGVFYLERNLMYSNLKLKKLKFFVHLNITL